MANALRILLLALVLGAAAAPAQDRTDAEAEATLSAVVRVQSRILPDARTAETLGVRREGSGILVREGYVLTIGYLVIEAESIAVTASSGSTVPALLAAYDHASGFGLLKLAAPLAGRPLPIGDASALAERDAAMVVGFGGREALNLVYVVSRRAFAGGWEYLLDAAIYTYPPVQNWSGAALINARGELLGVGSLVLPDAGAPGTQSPGNLFVPVDLLKPMLDDLIQRGRSAGPIRPWLGLNTDELRGRLFVSRVSPEGPADRAGLRSGDLVLAVGEDEVDSLADFYRKVWARGAAGTEIPLRVLQGSQVKELRVRSIDRLEYLRRKPTY
ncbi:MAG: S1C family serine protease [Betaproteobacteria bacterium]|nr:S1C family serine protease [Betaproteobacteria bacterium]